MAIVLLCFHFKTTYYYKTSSGVTVKSQKTLDMKRDLHFEHVDAKRVRNPQPSPFPKNHLQLSAKFLNVSWPSLSPSCGRCKRMTPSEMRYIGHTSKVLIQNIFKKNYTESILKCVSIVLPGKF